MPHLPCRPSICARATAPSYASRASTTRFTILNTNQLWSREVFASSAYQSLSNLAPGKTTARSNPTRSRADADPDKVAPLPEGVTVGDPKHIIGAIK